MHESVLLKDEEWNPVKSQWKKFYEDIQSGMTYAEVAEKYGVSKQRVHQVVKKHNATTFKKLTNDSCVYPHLRAWMNENKISRAEFNRRLWGYSHPELYRRLYSYLSGVADPPKRIIDRMIEVTGLPYEILFKKENDNEQREAD